MKISTKSFFLLKYSIDSEKIYQIRVTFLIKERFFRNLFFIEIFLFQKSEKILTKQFFLKYLCKLGKI